jgi:NACalpha-BTF3-like transcription factor
MDKKDQVPNISKRFEEVDNSSNNNNAGQELLDLAKNEEKPKEIIKINNKDLELLKNEIEMSQEEAMKILIKYKGDVKEAIHFYLNDFKFKKE